MRDLYNVEVVKFDSYQALEGGAKKGEIDENKLKQRVYISPIEDLGIDSSAMDHHVINNLLMKPLLIEIKELRNVS